MRRYTPACVPCQAFHGAAKEYRGVGEVFPHRRSKGCYGNELSTDTVRAAGCDGGGL
jgi:hypothetical protein